MSKDKRHRLIVLSSMIMVVGLVLVTATYAWFTESNRTQMNGLNLSLDGTGEIHVEVGVSSAEARMEMDKVDENRATIDMGLTRLANIEVNKLGPGAFGEVHFYITTDAASYNGYTISVTPTYRMVGTGSTNVLQLAKEHIKFYAVKSGDTYSEEIPYKEADGEMIGLTGTLQEDEETEVILYWYWPYEYAEVPNKSNISAKNTREYDLQDTMIGNYIESIGFVFEVEGNVNEN